MALINCAEILTLLFCLLKLPAIIYEAPNSFAISGIVLSDSLYCITDLRDLTFISPILVKLVLISSVTPSQNHWVSSSHISLKSNTAMIFSEVVPVSVKLFLLGEESIKKDTIIAMIRTTRIIIFNLLFV